MFNTLFTGKVFHQLKEVESTNDWLVGRLGENMAEGTVVLAENQTRGKGQAGNRWETDPGQNLTFSILFYPRFLSPSRVFYLNKMISCGLHSAMAQILPAEAVAVKWPNDLLVNGKKVAGVLTENQFTGTQIKTAVIGIGINVNQRDFPEEKYGNATSLGLELGQMISREGFLGTILECLEAEYLKLKAGRLDALDRKYLQLLWKYQEPGQYRVKGKERTGIITGVDKSGRLAVQFGQQLEYFQIKEIEFLG